ncbi:hypothetical protein VPHD479_0217 [Vibrio phage D479]
MILEAVIGGKTFSLPIVPNKNDSDEFTRKDMRNLEKWKTMLLKQPDVESVTICQTK